MASFVSHTTIDCHDAYALSEWWKPVLGYDDLPGDPNLPGHTECIILDPDPVEGAEGHRLLFIEVPDEVLPAKRIHFDVRPRERTQADEVAWLLDHGAALVADRRGIHGEGTGWITLADPEGNQLCVLRSLAELQDA
ncbi:MAG: VOC family protein [Aeromicrobium erythreum]